MKRDLVTACRSGLDSLQNFLHSFNGACRELTIYELESFSACADIFEKYPQNGFESLEQYASKVQREGIRDLSDLPEYDSAQSEAREMVRSALKEGNAMAALYHVLCYETLVRQLAIAKLENTPHSTSSITSAPESCGRR